MLKKIFKNQGSIALILVIMITSLTLISAVALTLINVSEKMANYQLQENEDVLNQKQACLDDALARISNNNYATGTYALDLTNVHCYYQMSETVSGLKTVTTTASSLSSLGAWSQSLKAIINVSSTPISISSYQDIVGPTWDSESWTKRIRISVQPNKVAGDLYNFPVYVNLAHLGADFFPNTQVDAGDIVVTTGDGSTKLLREVQSYGGLGQYGTEGALYFLAPYLSSSVATDFYIYFGNSSANETNDAGVWVNYQMVQHLDNNPNTGSPPHERDSTDHGNDLTTVGSIPNGQSVAAQVYRGINFESGDYFTIANLNDFTSTQGTISFWVKVNTLQVATLFHFYETATTDFMRAYLYANGDLDFTVEDGDVQMIQILNTFNPGTTNWHHVVWTQDGTGVDMYVDGQAATISGTNSGSWWTNHLSLSAGKIAGGSWGNTVAIMDEFRVSDKALSASWFATEYNNQSSASTFYSTSTIEVLSEPPACSGVDMYGYCWYMASAYAMSCDEVCAENGGLSCVSGVTYSDPSCALNLSFAPFTCDPFNCIEATGINYAPGNYTVGVNACLIDSGSPAYICDEVESQGNFKIICACQ